MKQPSGLKVELRTQLFVDDKAPPVEAAERLFLARPDRYRSEIDLPDEVTDDLPAVAAE